MPACRPRGDSDPSGGRSLGDSALDRTDTAASPPPQSSRTPLRLVFVSWEFPPEFGGGIGTYVDAVTRTLAARGHSVTVLTISSAGYPLREERNRVCVLRVPLAGNVREGPVETLRTWQARADAVADALVKLVRGGVDLIEFPDYRGEGVSYLSLSEPASRPVCVARLHTPLSVLYRFNRSHTRYAVLEEFEHEALRRAGRLVSPSRVLAQEMRGALGDAPIEHSPHPVDPDFLRDFGPRPSESDDVLYVGRLEERKGVETLVAAGLRLLEACPAARLKLIGGDTERSSDQPSMKAWLQRQIPGRLAGRVQFVDKLPRAELIEQYRAARLCVFPSHFENFPNTCLEAMALGSCVIAGAHSGMAEMIEAGVSGVLVPSGAGAPLAEALIDWFRRPFAERQTMGAAAAARIRARYHPDVIAGELERLYERYVSEHQGPSPRATPVAARQARPTGSPDQRVAVVIPCFNHGKFLPEAIASVRAQTVAVGELVVVDDGSTDEHTLRELDRTERQGIRVIHQPNAGLSAARNTGVRATSAPFYLPLDADDRIAPDFIEALLPPLIEDSALGYSYCQAQFFGASSGAWECPPYDPRRLLVENLSVASAIVRRQAFDQVGGYSTDMVHGFEDWDFWIALLSIGWHGRCTPRPLFFYRKHAGGSMLSETQKRRHEMVQRMIEHHRGLFASTLEVAFTQKDSMFFSAHLDAWRLREALARQGGSAAISTVDNELHQALVASAELNYIENSRFWKLLQSFKRNPLYRAYARLRFGAEWDRPPAGEDPRVRLDRIKSSRAYRAIQAVKRSSFYRMYARRKYGSEFDRPAEG